MPLFLVDWPASCETVKVRKSAVSSRCESTRLPSNAEYLRQLERLQS